MDTCPRCGGTLERLSLGDASTLMCERCGFADIPVDHERLEGREPESWRDAFDRFYEAVRD